MAKLSTCKGSHSKHISPAEFKQLEKSIKQYATVEGLEYTEAATHAVLDLMHEKYTEYNSIMRQLKLPEVAFKREAFLMPQDKETALAALQQKKADLEARYQQLLDSPTEAAPPATGDVLEQASAPLGQPARVETTTKQEKATVQRKTEQAKRNNTEPDPTEDTSLKVNDKRRITREDAGVPMLRRGATAGVGSTQEVIAGVVAKLGNKLAVTVQSVKELPQHLQDTLKEQKALDVGALFDPNTGQIYFIADNIDTPSDVVSALTHELAHASEQAYIQQLAQKLGNNVTRALTEWNRVRRAIYAAHTKEAQDLYTKKGYSDSFDIRTPEGQLALASELLAFRAETMKPRMLDRAVSAMRDVVRSIQRALGLNELAFNDTDIRALLKRMAAAPKTVTKSSEQSAAQLQRSDKVEDLVPDAIAAMEQDIRGGEHSWMGKNVLGDKTDNQIAGAQLRRAQDIFDAYAATKKALPKEIKTVADADKVADTPVGRNLLHHADMSGSAILKLSRLPRYVAQMYRDFMPVYNAGTKMTNEAIRRLHDLGQPVLETWGNLRNKTLFGGVNEKAIATDILYQLDLDYAEQNFHAKPVLKKDSAGKYQHVGDYAAYEAAVKNIFPNTPQRIIDAVVAAREALDKSWVMYIQGLEHAGATEKDIANAVEQIQKMGSYFPHTWYGNAFAVVRDKDGNEVVRVPLESRTGLLDADMNTSEKMKRTLAMKRLEKKLKTLFPQYKDMELVFNQDDAKKSNFIFNKNKADPMYATGYAPWNTIQALIEKSAATTAGDESVKKAVRTEMLRNLNELIKARSFSRVTLQRKGVQGYERENGFRVISDYLSGMANTTTKAKYAGELRKASNAINSQTHANIYNYAQKYTNDLLSNYHQLEGYVQAMKAAMALTYLGLNPSTAMLNLTQNVVLGVHELGRHMDESATVWMTKEVGPKLLDMLKLVTLDNQWNNLEKLSQNPKIAEDDRMLLRGLHESEAEGRIQSQFKREFFSEAKSDLLLAKSWNGLLRFAGSLSAASESFNRVTLYAAGFKAAYHGKITNADIIDQLGIRPKDYASAKRFAEYIVDNAHFDMSKANMPELFRGGGAQTVAQLAYTFMKFPHNYFAWSTAMLREGMRKNSGLYKLWNKDSRAALASVGTLMALGGLKATPLFGLVNYLFAALGGDDDDSIEDVIRQNTDGFMRDMILHGLVGSTTNLDLGFRMSPNIPAGDAIASGKSLPEVLYSLAGVPGAMIQDLVRMKQALDSRGWDDISTYAEFAPIPKAVRNISSALSWATGDLVQNGRGTHVTDAETGLPYTPTGWDLVAKSLGFQTLDLAKQKIVERDVIERQKFKTTKQSMFIDRAANALKDGDREKYDRALSDIMEWNARQQERGNYELIITGSSIKAGLKTRMEGRKPQKNMRGYKMQMIDEVLGGL